MHFLLLIITLCFAFIHKKRKVKYQNVSKFYNHVCTLKVECFALTNFQKFWQVLKKRHQQNVFQGLSMKINACQKVSSGITYKSQTQSISVFGKRKTSLNYVYIRYPACILFNSEKCLLSFFMLCVFPMQQIHNQKML